MTDAFFFSLRIRYNLLAHLYSTANVDFILRLQIPAARYLLNYNKYRTPKEYQRFGIKTAPDSL